MALFAFIALLFISPKILLAIEPVSEPIQALHLNQEMLRSTKNFIQQYKRVDDFRCESHLKGLHTSYQLQRRMFLEAENILDDEKRREITFTI